MTVPTLGAIQPTVQVAAHSLANAAAPGFEPSDVIFQAGPAEQVRGHVEHPPSDHDEPEIEAEAKQEEPSRPESDLADELLERALLNRPYKSDPRDVQTQNESIGHFLDVVA